VNGTEPDRVADEQTADVLRVLRGNPGAEDLAAVVAALYGAAAARAGGSGGGSASARHAVAGWSRGSLPHALSWKAGAGPGSPAGPPRA
jgi:hypothetical protein